MATTAKEFFDKRVPEALLANPSRAKEIAAIYLFKISGSEGGTWTADLMATAPPAQWANPNAPSRSPTRIFAR